MRSVVVVLPASMCAMIPMFRVFLRLKERGMRGCGVESLRVRFRAKKEGHSGPRTPMAFAGSASLSARDFHLSCAQRRDPSTDLRTAARRSTIAEGWGAPRPPNGDFHGPDPSARKRRSEPYQR